VPTRFGPVSDSLPGVRSFPGIAVLTPRLLRLNFPAQSGGLQKKIKGWCRDERELIDKVVDAS
jgi:hypothetical protein